MLPSATAKSPLAAIVLLQARRLLNASGAQATATATASTTSSPTARAAVSGFRLARRQRLRIRRARRANLLNCTR